MIRNPLYVYGPEIINVPTNLNFGQFITQKLWEQGDTPALINGIDEEVYTYRQLAQETLNLAVSLALKGLRKGQTVALCSENRKEFWATLFGAACCGATVTTVNPMYTASELKHVFGISKPKYVFCSPFFFKKHVRTLKESSYIKEIIVFGDNRPGKLLLYKDLAFPTDSSETDLVVRKRLTRNVRIEEFQAVDIVGQVDVLFILYSSGTTGLPKGVMLTHHNVLTFCHVNKFGKSDLLALSLTPWFHAMGLIGLISAFTVGKTMVFLPRFEVDLFLKTVEKYKIVRLSVVPPILTAACKSTANYDLSSVRIIASGAAPLQNDTISIVKKKFPNLEAVVQAYGMTECTLAVVSADYENYHLAKPGSVGSIVPNTIAKVVDTETRKPIGANNPGELCFKGPLIMKGYVGKDRKEDFDEEGFFKTGDIGYYDDDGQFFIVDRLKELIKYKANQVAPAEIEALLLQHEAVRDVGVVGRRDRESGEVPVAFVVKQPGKEVTDTELKDFVAERLSNPKRLRGGVKFVLEIPKNPSGKILRRELRKIANSHSKLFKMPRKQNYWYGPTDVLVPANMNLGSFLLDKFNGIKEKTAITNGATGNVVTYGQIIQEAMNLAVSLTHLGVRKGDVVAVCTENRDEFWGTMLGVICTGAIFTPYNPTYGTAEIRHVLSISKPNYLICSPIAYKIHGKTFHTTGSLVRIILYGDENIQNTSMYKELITPSNGGVELVVGNKLTRNVRYEEFEVVDVENGTDELLFIMYSSGTTGLPKGVMITHANAVFACSASVLKFTGASTLVITPWFHAMGLVGCLVNLVAAQSNIIYLPRFDIDLYLKTIEKYKIKQLLLVPAVLVALNKAVSKYDVSSVDTILCAASPLHKDVAQMSQERFPKIPGVVQGYGMTECTIAIAVNQNIDGVLKKPDSNGKVIPCTVVKIVDIETGKVLGPHQSGEICAKGAMLMKGYLGVDNKDTFDEEDFFKTGDIGYFDEDGYLYIVDRLKELIKYKSFQVPPAEIEALLLQHEAVQEAGVVGIPDREAGEVPLAFVVKQPEKSVTEKELQEFVAKRLSNPKRLRGGVRFIPEIPKNASGKILRKELRNIVKNSTSKL
ncbi:uncharacterized protein LOC131855206 [Achroia grisella]|uniref:uncharacterized protein LOC131855206 n=1 Tax=Achroia grisella TaxID=688607 RepID=UPI0027D2BE4D|nr:uncharacterized protein LOC131855206 [Achroia grisella]